MAVDDTGASPVARRGDLEWGTLPLLVHSSGERFGDKAAIIDTTADGDVVEITFAGLEQRSRHLAKGLIATGIRHGDRVAIWAPNIWEWIVATIGMSMVGAVLVPINTRFKGREAAYVLGRAGVSALVTVEELIGMRYLDMLRATPGGNPLGPDRTILARGADADATTWSQLLERGDAVSDEELDERIAAVRPDDLCDISFTSGTTGNPKGVMATHAQVLRGYLDWSELVGLRSSDNYLIVSPFFHAFGFKAGWLAALMQGATVFPETVFDGTRTLERIERDQISMLPGPPTIYQTLLNDPTLGSHDISSLRLAVTGAASIPVELIHRMRTLGFERIITGYGLTEATGICTMCHYLDDPETIAHTAGRAIPGVEVRIVDGSGNEVPVGTNGEVVVRGYNVTSGYWDDPAATAETIVDGWLHTGDIGVLDERGYLTITDRAKDMFIVGGFNVYPAEIENLLLGHPDVAAVAVVGVPDERLGEVGMAYVVPRVGAELSASRVIEWSRREMANFKVPRYVEIVDVLPMNAAGKVLKYELRERGEQSARRL